MQFRTLLVFVVCTFIIVGCGGGNANPENINIVENDIELQGAWSTTVYAATTWDEIWTFDGINWSYTGEDCTYAGTYITNDINIDLNINSIHGACVNNSYVVDDIITSTYQIDQNGVSIQFPNPSWIYIKWGSIGDGNDSELAGIWKIENINGLSVIPSNVLLGFGRGKWVEMSPECTITGDYSANSGIMALNYTSTIGVCNVPQGTVENVNYTVGIDSVTLTRGNADTEIYIK